MASRSPVTMTVTAEPTLHMRLQVQNVVRGPSSGTVSPRKIKNFRVDPLRALEPARKKLTTVEAQRVMTVFEETIRRVQIVTLLPYIMQNLDRFQVSMGSELVELLKHHSIVVSSYDEIRQQLDIHLEKRAAEQENALKLKGKPLLSERQEIKLLEKLQEDKVEKAENEEDEPAIAKPEEDQQKENATSEREGSATSVREEGSVLSENSSEEESTDFVFEAAVRNLSLVAQQISHSTRNILRAFTANPVFLVMVTDTMAESRVPECQVVLQYLHELRDILLHKLLNTPAEERERRAYLGHIAKRERLNAVIIEKLEQELKVKNDDKETEIAKKNKMIQKLQVELHQVEKFSEEHIRRVRADAEKQEVADEKSSEARRQKWQAEVAQMRAFLATTTSEHRNRELDLRGKKYKVESEIETWILKYDEELGWRQEEYEEIDAIYTQEKQQLHELEVRFGILEKEYLAIRVERQLAREQREKAERMHAMLMRGATTIQAFWRSHKVRKMLKSRKKKKTGEGKKGKGKKGGKKK